MNPSVLNEVMALPAVKKLDLIDKLWESISPELDQADLSDEEKKLLDERWENYLKNPESALNLDQVKALVAARLDC
jgi:putative addiction module component (TIGR02574 family)